MPQSLAQNTIHLVFSTKHREALLMDSVRSDLHAYITTVLKNLSCPLLRINSVPDHIHLLFVLHRTVPLSKAVEDIKKSSSKWLKTQSKEAQHFAWQSGYGAFSVSHSNLPAVKTYIDNQEEHHRTVTFKEELRVFLDKHEIGYDEAYLWD